MSCPDSEADSPICGPLVLTFSVRSSVTSMLLMILRKVAAAEANSLSVVSRAARSVLVLDRN